MVTAGWKSPFLLLVPAAALVPGSSGSDEQGPDNRLVACLPDTGCQGFDHPIGPEDRVPGAYGPYVRQNLTAYQWNRPDDR